MEGINNIPVYFPNHQKHTMSGLCNLKNNEMFCDVKIACGDKIFSAHKVVLSIYSDYFHYLLKEINCQCPLIVFKELSSLQMTQILEFIYEGKVKVTTSQVKAFMEAALYLQIKGCDWFEQKIVDDESNSFKICEEGYSQLLPTTADASDIFQDNLPSKNEDKALIQSTEQTKVYIEIKEPALDTSQKPCTSTSHFADQGVITKGFVKFKDTKLKRSNPKIIVSQKKNPTKKILTLVCPYCDKVFRNTSHRKEHVRTHTGEKPFRCSVCLISFRHSKSLRRHEKIQHLINKSKGSSSRR